MLRARGLRKRFGGQIVLDGVDLDMHRGEVVILTGRNGAGKTTLVNVLTGNLEPDGGSIELRTNGDAERFCFPRRWWQHLRFWDRFTPERMAREGVGRAWQDIRLFGTQTLLDNIAVAMPHQPGEKPGCLFGRPREVLRRERANRRDCTAMLVDLGLDRWRHASADKVSLGQAKRVAIARAVRAGARVLFLDEPLSGLDANGISEVTKLLGQIVQEHRVTLLIVEHILNTRHLSSLATSIWHLQAGRLSATRTPANGAQVANAADHPTAWLDTIRTPHSRTECLRLPGDAMLTVLTPEVAAVGEVTLEARDLVVHRGNRLVIGKRCDDGRMTGISFCLRRNQLALLAAPNGWGKTTALFALAGLLPPTSGQVFLNGRNVTALPAWKRVQLGLSFLTSGCDSFPGLTVAEAMRLSRNRSCPDEMLPLAIRRISALSGGERRKVAWASMPQNSVVMLMDEPFSGLDGQSIRDKRSYIRSLKNRTLLIAEPSACPTSLSDDAANGNIRARTEGEHS